MWRPKCDCSKLKTHIHSSRDYFFSSRSRRRKLKSKTPLWPGLRRAFTCLHAQHATCAHVPGNFSFPTCAAVPLYFAAELSCEPPAPPHVLSARSRRARARVQAAAAMASQDWYASSLDAFVSRGADSAKWRSQTPFDPPAVAEPLAAKDSSKAVGQKAPTSFSRDHITVSSAADVLPPLPMVQHCSSKLPLPPLNDEVVRSRLCPLQPNPLTAGGRARPRRISPLVPIEHRRDNNGLLPSRQREGLR